ncbi:MAG: DNA double-strand break repair nuclease NurA [Anaerolineales bacterium]|nr:DNA double-strand break repair nuclease NurA [Anaerolineales bacterium]MBS3752236.1 DNA double-strand break repair nuclease NurA [Anaerolineales bacterium]
MSLNYEQLQPQVRDLGERAVVRENHLNKIRRRAGDLLQEFAQQTDRLQGKVEKAAGQYPALRCARPKKEALTSRFTAPEIPDKVGILAADGSQINPDPHAAVQYYLVNVGGIWFDLHRDYPPQTSIETQLRFEEDIYTSHGLVSQGHVALERDVAEREYIAIKAGPLCKAGKDPFPLVTLTDGPLELWESHERSGSRSPAFRKGLKRYQEALRDLSRMGTVTAGYVDKPRADYVLRLLELATLADGELSKIAEHHPFQGLSDIDLYASLLRPGERSGVFGIQAFSSSDYTDEIALHFFYLNVGRAGNPWLARVEVPAWVVEDGEKMNCLHAVLLQQCRMMGGVGYPYVLHRAHEIAVVGREEQELLTEMILRERRKRGVSVGQRSHKRYYKDQAGRKRYRR